MLFQLQQEQFLFAQYLWIKLALLTIKHVSFFPLANDFSSLSLKMKLKCLFKLGCYWYDSILEKVLHLHVESQGNFRLLIQRGKIIFQRYSSILLQLKSIEGVGVWRLWQIKPLHSSHDNDGESEGNPYHTPTTASAPCFYHQDVEHIYFLSLNSNVTEYRADLLNRKVQFSIMPFQNWIKVKIYLTYIAWN